MRVDDEDEEDDDEDDECGCGVVEVVRGRAGKESGAGGGGRVVKVGGCFKNSKSIPLTSQSTSSALAWSGLPEVPGAAPSSSAPSLFAIVDCGLLGTCPVEKGACPLPSK